MQISEYLLLQHSLLAISQAASRQTGNITLPLISSTQPFTQPFTQSSEQPSANLSVQLSAQPFTHLSTRQSKNEVGQPSKASVSNLKYQPAVHQTDTHAVTMGALVVLVPLGLLISVVVHRRLKTTVLQRRIASLEKLWQLNCHEEIQ
jgi:hypothetical protein